MKTRKPDYYARITPCCSKACKTEAETLAKLMMLCLSKTGNQWRRMTWEEYVVVRQTIFFKYCFLSFLARPLDPEGHMYPWERKWFKYLVDFTVSQNAAENFSAWWR